MHQVSKQEVEVMIDAAITRHNRNASMISMVLGITFLALFVDGFMRVIGMVPPFLGIDVNIMSEVAENVREEVLMSLHNMSA
tara:strand:- start:2060 stop:2305 length:246 start_codon:yes stop_codon:yes gene_type:complete